jgi:hypothetical protein
MKILLVCLVICVLQTSFCLAISGRRGGRGRSRTTPAPSVECPAIECPDNGGVCPYGYKRDEHGCQLCECKASWRCQPNEPQPTCRKYCEFGFVVGADGCPTCDCFDPATPSQLPAPSSTNQQQSSRHHHHHHHHDHGNASATAIAALSPSVTAAGNSSATVCGPICLMFCENGMKTDANGCPICECNDQPPAVGVEHRGGRGRGRPGRRNMQCFRPMCAMYCPDGYRRDQTGCTLCECRQEGDAPFRNTDNAVQCPVMQCHRSRRCAHGFASDPSTGCPSCVCRSSPVS